MDRIHNNNTRGLQDMRYDSPMTHIARKTIRFLASSARSLAVTCLDELILPNHLHATRLINRRRPKSPNGIKQRPRIEPPPAHSGDRSQRKPWRKPRAAREPEQATTRITQCGAQNQQIRTADRSAINSAPATLIGRLIPGESESRIGKRPPPQKPRPSADSIPTSPPPIAAEEPSETPPHPHPRPGEKQLGEPADSGAGSRNAKRGIGLENRWLGSGGGGSFEQRTTMRQHRGEGKRKSARGGGGRRRRETKDC